MASTLANVTGLSVMVGLGSGLQTLGSQAFGAGAYHLVGLHFQRCLSARDADPTDPVLLAQNPEAS